MRPLLDFRNTSSRAVDFCANKVLSSPDAIAQVIEKHLEEKEGIQQSLPMPDPGAGKVKNGGAQTANKPVVHRFEEQAALTFIGTCPDCGSGLESSPRGARSAMRAGTASVGEG